MNACLRAVVRTALARGLEVWAIERGYWGFMENFMFPLDARAVANILQRGGTILKTGRAPEFQKAENRVRAFQNLQANQIDAAVCIGGDGSFRGAMSLWREFNFPVVGAPGTIDNDLFGTDLTIGFDTAVNTALDAIDKIRDTANSHDRLFIVEVMGRNSGHIAAHVGLACGAEEVFTPEINTTVDKAVEKILESQKKGKKSSIIISAEGQKPGRAYDLGDSIRKKTGLDAKVVVLGHVQRGGSPTAKDRIIAAQIGSAAVDFLLQGQCDIMTGISKNEIVSVPFELATQRDQKSSLDFVKLSNLLAI